MAGSINAFLKVSGPAFLFPSPPRYNPCMDEQEDPIARGFQTVAMICAVAIVVGMGLSGLLIAASVRPKIAVAAGTFLSAAVVWGIVKWMSLKR